MSKIEPVTAQAGHNLATINTTGGILLAKGGGHIGGPIVVQTAGSSDAVGSLYDGTSTSGALMATFSLGKKGAAQLPNLAFAKGLFLQVSGTTAGQFQVMHTGSASAV